jgi:hypothetical protein
MSLILTRATAGLDCRITWHDERVEASGAEATQPYILVLIALADFVVPKVFEIHNLVLLLTLSALNPASLSWREQQLVRSDLLGRYQVRSVTVASGFFRIVAHGRELPLGQNATRDVRHLQRHLSAGVKEVDKTIRSQSIRRKSDFCPMDTTKGDKTKIK